MSKYKIIQTDSHLLLVDENIRGTSGWNYNYGLSKIDNLPYSKEKHSTEWNCCVKIIKASPKLGDLPEFDILTPELGFIDISDEKCKSDADYHRTHCHLNEKYHVVQDMIKNQDQNIIITENYIIFNKEDYNKHISDVIKETLRFASQNAEIKSCGNPYDYEDDSKCVDENSIMNSFDEIFRKFKK